MNGFRLKASRGTTIEVAIGGRIVSLTTDRSLLALLLADGSAPVDYFCGIGQCFRCEVEVSGERLRACMYYPRSGDLIRVPPAP